MPVQLWTSGLGMRADLTQLRDGLRKEKEELRREKEQLAALREDLQDSEKEVSRQASLV